MKRTLAALLLAPLLVLASCSGGGGGGSAVVASGTGTLTVEATDAFLEHSQVDIARV